MNFDLSRKPAITGGPKAKQTPFGRRKRHDDLEKKLLGEVIDSDVLFFYLGTKVRELERRFADMYGRRHCIACSSGTASVHIAIASLQLTPGSEVITSAITDMGSTTGILYQGLVPVFADIDPDTLNMDVRAVREKITNRTRAILVVHHAGLAADIDGLMALGAEFGLPVVEDCAQAYGCEYKGKLVGAFAPISAFSLNHFKHITCGSGGMVLTDDDRLRYIASLLLDKCYQRDEGIRNPFFLAANYQMTELQGAVALAQLEKLAGFTGRRHELGSRLDAALRGVPGIGTQKIAGGDRHSYFLYLFKIDPDLFGCSAEEFSLALLAEGVPNKARLITGGRPVYLYDIFQNHSAFPGSKWPFVSKDTGADREYRAGDCPAAEEAFSRWITMDLHEYFTETDIDEIALGIAKVAHHFAARKESARLAGDATSRS